MRLACTLGAMLMGLQRLWGLWVCNDYYRICVVKYNGVHISNVGHSVDCNACLDLDLIARAA